MKLIWKYAQNNMLAALHRAAFLCARETDGPLGLILLPKSNTTWHGVQV